MPDSPDLPPAAVDASPPDAAVLAEVVAGLAAAPRTLPSKLFYDEAGSRLFDRITELDAYYPTRTELGILRDHLADVAAAVGGGAALIEFGSGSSLKTRLLLDALVASGRAPAAYVPIDISGPYLLGVADGLREAYPDVPVLPVVADYTRSFALPDLPTHRRRVVFFPGSTIGNFEPDEAARFFHGVAGLVGEGGGLLLGVDRKKDPAVLHRAYDDEEGVTAAFNLNLLTRLNREFGADFDPARWRHEARYNEALGRVEMHLASVGAQAVRVGGDVFAFADGETIHTENSYKYAPGELEAVAAPSGLVLADAWTDEHDWFALLWFVNEPLDA